MVPMSTTLGPIHQDGHVVVVGGGPSGTGCALALQNLAIQAGRRLQITIIEGKNFESKNHSNQCAGVLSPPLPKLLEKQLKIPFPNHLIRENILGYILHADNERIQLEEQNENSTAFRRIHFDAYMLSAAKEHGITICSARMTGLEFHADHVRIFTESGSFQADIVVGAFGLDEGSGDLFSQHTCYCAPRFINSIVYSYHVDPGKMVNFGKYIHAFLPTSPQIEFGAITPKGNHLTINIAGKSVNSITMKSFINSVIVQKILPVANQTHNRNEIDFQLFKGRFPNSLARGYYGDRFVMVGDAAGLVRAFKGKGVTSAIQTGIRAAETIIYRGISKSAFHDHYRTANQDIIGDLPFGQGMRLAVIFLKRLGLIKPVVRAARITPTLRLALFDAVSAHAPYRNVLAQTLKPKILLAILREIRFTF